MKILYIGDYNNYGSEDAIQAIKNHYKDAQVESLETSNKNIKENVRLAEEQAKDFDVIITLGIGWLYAIRIKDIKKIFINATTPLDLENRNAEKDFNGYTEETKVHIFGADSYKLFNDREIIDEFYKIMPIYTYYNVMSNAPEYLLKHYYWQKEGSWSAKNFDYHLFRNNNATFIYGDNAKLERACYKLDEMIEEYDYTYIDGLGASLFTRNSINTKQYKLNDNYGRTYIVNNMGYELNENSINCFHLIDYLLEGEFIEKDFSYTS